MTGTQTRHSPRQRSLSKWFISWFNGADDADADADDRSRKSLQMKEKDLQEARQRAEMQAMLSAGGLSSTGRSRKPAAKPIPTSPAKQSSGDKEQVADDSLIGWLFWLACVFLLPVLVVIACVRFPRMVAARQEANPSYPYPQLGDIWITGVSLLVFLPGRMYLAKNVFVPIGEYLLPTCEEKPKWTPEIRAMRLERFGNVSFKFFYFVSITAFGYWILKDADFFPPQLGGIGFTKNLFHTYPYPDPIPWLKEYYLVELGYHVQSIIFHFMGEHRNDYLEMLLHHTCAILLVLFSYYCNFLRAGALILMVHDIADVVGYAIKMSVDTRYTKITLSIYATLLFTWAYTRFYVFPYVILGSVYEYTSEMELLEAAGKAPDWWRPADFNFFLIMLYILLFLHVYWFCLFLYMGYMFLHTGETKDIQQKINKDDDYVTADKDQGSETQSKAKKMD